MASLREAITPLRMTPVMRRYPPFVLHFPQRTSRFLDIAIYRIMEQRLILINLLIKLGVAASAASILGRSVEFKSLLFRDERNWKQRIYLVLWIGIPLALGVWIRFSARSFLAGDLSFETTILLGVIGGRLTGVLGGVLLALPAFGTVSGRLYRSTCYAALWLGSCETSLPIARISGRSLPALI